MSGGVIILITAAGGAFAAMLGQDLVQREPANTAALNEALHRTLSDAELRANLIDRGLTQSKKFSWAKAADELEAIYNSLAKG